MFFLENSHFYTVQVSSILYLSKKAMSSFKHIRFQHIKESDLLDFFESKHNAHAKSMLDLIQKNIKSALKSNPLYESDIQDIICLLEQLDQQISKLMKLQEENLYPFVRKLIEVSEHEEPIKFLNTGLMQSSINSIRAEHTHIVALLHSIEKISNHYTPPEHSNELLRLCYSELKEFESVIKLKLLSEDSFLFPRIIDLESRVLEISSTAKTGTGGRGVDDM